MVTQKECPLSIPFTTMLSYSDPFLRKVMWLSMVDVDDGTIHQFSSRRTVCKSDRWVESFLSIPLCVSHWLGGVIIDFTVLYTMCGAL